jgi:hypothetical protein
LSDDLYQNRATNRFSGINFPTFSCPLGNCQMMNFELAPIASSTITTLERPHPLVWIGTVGGYNSLLFTILFYIAYVSGSVIGLITSKIKQLIFLNYLFLFPPKKDDKSTIVHRILNVQILRTSEFHPKTYFGVCLTLIYFLIMFFIFLFLLVDNYSSLFNDRGPTIEFSTLNAKSLNTQFEMEFTCASPGGCAVQTTMKPPLAPTSCMNEDSAIATGTSKKIVFCYQTYVTLFGSQKNPVPSYPNFNEIGYLTASKDPNEEKHFIRSFNDGNDGDNMGEMMLEVTIENFFNSLGAKTKTNFIPK